MKVEIKNFETIDRLKALHKIRKYYWTNSLASILILDELNESIVTEIDLDDYEIVYSLKEARDLGYIKFDESPLNIINETFNKLKEKFLDAQSWYNSLSDKDKERIETLKEQVVPDEFLNL